MTPAHRAEGATRTQIRDAQPDARRRALVTDSAFTAAAQVTGIVGALGLTVVAADRLSKPDFAALMWALSTSAIVALIGAPGIGIALLTLGGRARRELGTELSRIGIVAGATTAAATVLWLIAGPATTGDRPVLRNSVTVVGMLAPAAVGYSLLDALARLRRRFGLAVLLGDGTRRLLVVGLLLTSASAGRWRPASLVAVAVVEYALLALIGLILIRDVGRLSMPRSPELTDTARSLWAFAPGAAYGALVPQAGIWLAAPFTEEADLADFSVALRLAYLLLVPTAIVSRVIQPRLATARDITALERPIRSASTIVGGASLVGFVAYVAGGRWVLRLFAGAEYGTAYHALLLLAAAMVASAVTGMCGQCLIASGHERSVSRPALVSCAAFFLLTPLAASRFGATGIAGASFVCVAGLNVVLLVLARRRLGVNTLPLVDPASYRALLRGRFA